MNHQPLSEEDCRACGDLGVPALAMMKGILVAVSVAAILISFTSLAINLYVMAAMSATGP